VLEEAEADRLLGEQRKLFTECDRLDAWIIVKLWVAPDGKATQADVVTASGKHPRIWSCAVAPLAKLVVSPPSGGRATVYEFPMRFRGAEKLR